MPAVVMTTVDPASTAPTAATVEGMLAEVVGCFACPRLVAWREQVAREKRAAFADEQYWGRPVPSIGDPNASVIVVGLAPAAHGGNRTGRMFTGDRAGDWLVGALYRTGYANQPESNSRDDGLELTGIYVTAAVRCAPPDNKPTPHERNTCQPWLIRELELLPKARVAVCLGTFAYNALWHALRSMDTELPTPRPAFAHGAEVRLASGLTIINSMHPSQRNTFTRRLTEPMLDAVFVRARELDT